jgi:hypothetical protein
MLSKQYFIVRPTADALRRFKELAIDDEEDVVNPRVWSQKFDLRVTVTRESRQWCIDVVRLQYIALVLSELEEVGVTALSGIPLGDLWNLWQVEWIDGGLADSDGLTFSESVIRRLIANHTLLDPSIFAELEKAMGGKRGQA